MQVANNLTEHVKKLTEAINEVKNTVEADTYGIDPGDTLVPPLLFLPLKLDL